MKMIKGCEQIVLREEADDWSILFDPETGESFVVDPVATLIWKHLDGKNSLEQIVSKIKESCEGVPDEVSQHCNDFVEELVKKGLAQEVFPC